MQVQSCVQVVLEELVKSVKLAGIALDPLQIFLLLFFQSDRGGDVLLEGHVILDGTVFAGDRRDGLGLVV